MEWEPSNIPPVNTSGKSMPPKTLLVFCDGTGFDGALAPPKFEQKTQSTTVKLTPVEGGGSGYVQYATNVLRLSRAVKSHDSKGNRQIVFYQSGVGSEATFTGDPAIGTTALQTLGTAVASKIRDAYVFLAQNYDDGDDICLFGFSRGAYTARKLSGLIDRIGLLTRRNLGYFFEIWRDLLDKKEPIIPSDTRRDICLKCVGVWDTVGAVYHEIDALNIVDTALPPNIKVALHAVSLQENRKMYLPTLWTIPSGGLRSGQSLKQVWFAGAHSDVAGGYERHELADISLFWMAGEVEPLIDLDLKFLRSLSQANPDPWGTSQPHNAYEELSFAQQRLLGHETRLESGHIVKQSVYHQSVANSPQSLKSPKYMITTDIIRQSFGPDFSPLLYPVLNSFEQYCKDHWGSGVTETRPGSDSPSIVVRTGWSRAIANMGVPTGTILGGQMVEDWLDSRIYVARAEYKGSIQPGKSDGKVAWIGWGDETHLVTEGFEYLVGPQTSVMWASISGPLILRKLDGYTPVPGGYELDPELRQRVLFIAQARMANGSTHCGKVWERDIARIPYSGIEVKTNTYSVLVYV